MCFDGHLFYSCFKCEGKSWHLKHVFYRNGFCSCIFSFSWLEVHFFSHRQYIPFYIRSMFIKYVCATSGNCHLLVTYSMPGTILISFHWFYCLLLWIREIVYRGCHTAGKAWLLDFIENLFYKVIFYLICLAWLELGFGILSIWSSYFKVITIPDIHFVE